ncbi:MAG: hypothetical protein WCF84_10935 [Anaerolineae bacterium]
MATKASNEFAAAMEQAEKAQQTGNSELAYAFFARATELDPNSGSAWYGRAGTAGDPDDALVSLGYATALQPENTELPPQLEFYTQMRASVVGPTDAPTLVLVGQKLAEVGLTGQAEFLFRRAKELDDNVEDASVWLAAVTKDPAEAERLLKKVLAQNPNNPLARSGLGGAELTPDIGRKAGGPAKPAGAGPAPAALSAPAAPAPTPEPEPQAEESELPDWLQGGTEAIQAAPEKAEAPADDFASQLWRDMAESPEEAPAQPAAEATVPEDLASQPWWGELEHGAEESAQEPTAAASVAPDDLASQSWWNEIKPESQTPAETEAASGVMSEQVAEPAQAAEQAASWWDTTEEVPAEATPTAPARDAAKLAADLVRQGQEALAGDDKPAAYTLFVGAIELMSNNEAAWLGRARSTDDSAERIECFEKVLEINPNNMPAREALTLSRIRKMRDEGRRIPGARERERIEPREEEPKPRQEERRVPEPEPELPSPAPAARKEEPPVVKPVPVAPKTEPAAAKPTPAPRPEPRKVAAPPPTPAPEPEPEKIVPEPAPVVRQAPAPTPRQEEQVTFEPAPALHTEEPKPEPLPVTSDEEWTLPDKFRSPGGGWNIPQAAPAPTVLPIPVNQRGGGSEGFNVRPWLLILGALVIILLMVLATLWILKL